MHPILLKIEYKFLDLVFSKRSQFYFLNGYIIAEYLLQKLLVTEFSVSDVAKGRGKNKFISVKLLRAPHLTINLSTWIFPDYYLLSGFYLKT